MRFSKLTFQINIYKAFSKKHEILTGILKCGISNNIESDLSMNINGLEKRDEHKVQGVKESSVQVRKKAD